MFINDKNNDGPLSPVSSNLPRVYTGNVYSNKQLAAQKLPFCLILTDKTLQNNYHKPTTTLNTFSDSLTNSLVFGWGNGKQGWSLIRTKQKSRPEPSVTWNRRIGLYLSCTRVPPAYFKVWPIWLQLKCHICSHGDQYDSTLCVPTSYSSLCLLSNILLYNGIVNQA